MRQPPSYSSIKLSSPTASAKRRRAVIILIDTVLALLAIVLRSVPSYCFKMHAFTLFTAASAALGAVASPTPIKSRQETSHVGYLISTFSDARPQVQQYLSNGNSASSFTFLNGGQPILASTVGTKGVRDIYLTTNADRSQYYLIATGRPSKLPINTSVGC